MSFVTAEMKTIFRQNLEAFVIFSEEEWMLFSEHLYLRNIKKRDPFISQGSVCHEVGFIFSGSFRFFFLKEGVELSNFFSFKGELVSSYNSFLRREPSLLNIQAMEDSVVICFSYSALQQLSNNPKTAFIMERFGRMVAEYIICCYEERMISFISQNPEERYRQLLQKQPDLVQRIPQHYVANYLGITPVSLSRIRKRLYAAAKNKLAVVTA